LEPARTLAIGVAAILAIAATGRAHEPAPGEAPIARPDVEYLKAKIAEAKALDAIGRSGFQGARAYLPQCVFRYASCISGCSSSETGCYVVADPDDEKRTNHAACVEVARQCRRQCGTLECAKQLRLTETYPCD